MEHPNKEQQMPLSQDRLNKEEAYEIYGPYAPKEVVDRMKGKAPKAQQPYPLGGLPGVPEEIEERFYIAQYKASPEKNAKSWALIDFYDEQTKLQRAEDDRLNRRVRNYSIAANQALITKSNAELDAEIARTLPDPIPGMSRQGASMLAMYQMQQSPEEMAKFAEATQHLGQAAYMYGTPAAAVEKDLENQLYLNYYNKLKNVQLSLSFFDSPIAKAMTPNDLEIVQNIVASQNEEISEALNSSAFTFQIAKNEFLDSLQKQVEEGKATSAQFVAANQILERGAASRGFLAGLAGGATEWFYYLGADVNDILDENNLAYDPDTGVSMAIEEQAKAIRDGVPFVNATPYSSVGGDLALFRAVQAYQAPRKERENFPLYHQAAVVTGKSFEEIKEEQRKNLEQQVSSSAAAGILTTATMFINFGGSLALKLPGVAGMNAMGKAAVKGVGDTVGAALIGAGASAPFEGEVEQLKYQAGQEYGLKSEYDSAAEAFGMGMFNNVLENLAGGVLFDTPHLAVDFVDWGREWRHINNSNAFLEEANQIANISTTETAPEATERAIVKELFQKGRAPKVKYISPEDLRELKDAIDLGAIDASTVTDAQREFLFGDLEQRLQNGDYLVLTSTKLGTLFKDDSVLKSALIEKWRDTTTARNAEEWQALAEARGAFINDVINENNDLAINTPEEREQAKVAAYHEIGESVKNEMYRSIVAADHEKLNTSYVELVSREVSGMIMSMADANNIAVGDVLKFAKDNLPKVKIRQSKLDVASGYAKDNVRGTYDAETNTISLTADADIVTMIHELSHFYVEFLMRMADAYPENKRLAASKRMFFEGYANGNTEFVNMSWNDVDPQLKTVMQESFAQQYVNMRAKRTFSPDDYEYVNTIDENGNKTGRRHVENAKLDRIFASTFAKYFGQDISGKKDPEIKEAVERAVEINNEQFAAEYGINVDDIPESVKLFAMMVDDMTQNFADEHRIATRFPMGEFLLKLENVDGITDEMLQRYKEAFEVIKDEHTAAIHDGLNVAGRSLLRAGDKMLKMAEDNLKMDPRAQHILAEEQRTAKALEEAQKQNTQLEHEKDLTKQALDEFRAKKLDLKGDEKYTTRMKNLRARVTHLKKSILTKSEKMQTLYETELPGAFAKMNDLTRQRADLAAKYVKMEQEHATYMLNVQTTETSVENYKARRDELAAQVKQANKEGNTKLAAELTEELKEVRAQTKRQTDSLRRYKATAEKQQQALDANLAEQSDLAVKETQASAEIDEINRRIPELNNEVEAHKLELQEKSAELELDPMVEIDNNIATTREVLKQLTNSVKESRTTVSTLKAQLADLKRQHKEAKDNVVNELKKVQKQYGTAKERLARIRKQVEQEIDNFEGPDGRMYKEARDYKAVLAEAEPDDMIWNEALDKFGCDSVEELKALLDKRTDRKAIIDELTISRYKHNEHSEFVQNQLNDIALKHASQVFNLECKLLEGRLNQNTRAAARIAIQVAKQFRGQAGALRYGNTSTQQLLNRAQNMRIKANQVLAKLNTYSTPEEGLEKAYEYMVQARMFTETAQAAIRMRRELERELRRVRDKVTAKGVNDRLPAETVETVKVMLSRIGFIKYKNARVKLDAIKELDPDTYARVGQYLNENANIGHYTQMQMGDLFTMLDLVNTVISDGEQLLQAEKDARKIALGQEAQEALAAMNPEFELNAKLKERLEEAEAGTVVSAPDASHLHGWQKTVETIRSMRNSTISMQALAERLDGGPNGPFFNYVYKPITDAESRLLDADAEYGRMMQSANEKIRPWFNPKDPRNKGLRKEITWRDLDGKLVIIKPSSPDESIRKTLIPILVHLGNDSNLQALARSLNMDADDLVSRINYLVEDGTINTEMMDYVQAIWDAYDKVGIETQKAYKAMNNRYFTPIPGRPVTIAGKEYRGGYAPLIRKRGLAQAENLGDFLNDFANDLPPSNSPGFTKERSAASALPLDLTFDSLFNGISRQMRYAYLMPAINRNFMLMKANPELVRNIELLVPRFREEIWEPWIKAVAHQATSDFRNSEQANLFLRFISRVNQGIMTLNFVNAAQQFTGFIVATAKVSPKALFAASFRPMKDKDIFALSTFMKTRLQDEKHTLSMATRDLRAYTKRRRAVNWAEDHAYILQTKIQNLIDRRVWTAKYNEVLKKTKNQETAIAQADQAVRLTQGSFRASDSTGLDRSNMAKALMPFSQYFTAMANLFGARYSNLTRASQSKLFRGVVASMLAAQVILLPSFVGVIIASGVNGKLWQDDDEEMNDLLIEAGITSPLTAGASMIHPALGMVMTMCTNMATGEYTSSSLFNQPIATMLPNFGRGVWKIIEGGWDELTPNDVVNVIRPMVGAGMLPSYTQPFAERAMVSYLLATDEFDNDNAVDNIRAIVTGKASPEQKGE